MAILHSLLMPWRRCTPTALQAAYAYSLISSQAASVVGAMEQVWSGGDAPPNGSADGAGSSGQPGAEQQAARLQQALESKDDGEDVYVQVRL